jgi:protein-S-isoprenylcysteine O-methyltransferase Ste14
VLAQSALILAFAVVAALVRWPHPRPTALLVAGIVLTVAGLVVIVWSRVALGKAFTPFPRPRAGAHAVASGPYRFVRHPMYAGILVCLAGIGLLRSVPALVVLVPLAVLWWYKAAAEERRLEATYPDYEAYRRRTPHRFVPLP